MVFSNKAERISKRLDALLFQSRIFLFDKLCQLILFALIYVQQNIDFVKIDLRTFIWPFSAYRKKNYVDHFITILRFEIA